MSKLRQRLGTTTRPPKPLSPENQRKLQQGLALHHSGRLDEAAACYREILKTSPLNFDALHLLGATALQQGRLDDARALLPKAVRINPSCPFAQNNFGNLLFQLKRNDEARTAFKTAIRLDPNFAEARNNLASVLLRSGLAKQALEEVETALKQKPGYVDALATRGLALYELKRFDEALASCREALRISPPPPEACNTAGLALSALSRIPEALAAFERACALRPSFPEPWKGRAECLLSLSRNDDALQSIDRAIALAPDEHLFHVTRALVLDALRRPAEALASHEEALRLKPDCPFQLGTATLARMSMADWSRYDQVGASMRSQIQNGRPASPPFPLLSVLDEPEIHLQCARIYSETFTTNQTEGFAGPVRSGERLKIGYYSADCFNHAVANLIAELFEVHDRARFDVHLFSFAKPIRDFMRERLERSGVTFHDVYDRSAREISNISRNLGIDVAIDLNGHTTNSRPAIFAIGAAPIQAQYLGYPGTLGADYIDYVIADEWVIPEREFAHYAEKVVWLPGCYQVNDSKRLISLKDFTRADVGLPEDVCVFCCFNNTYKINADVFDSWMEILRATPGSVLWLLRDNDHVVANLRREAQARGVDPDRLIFAPRVPPGEHLARHRCADLFLDTLPYNAHTTGSDALRMGLPMLTRPGRSFASRVGASLMSAIGMPELIVETREAYVATAIDIARNPGRLAELKAKLARNRETSDLFSGKAFARKIERAFEMMAERHRAGLPPDHLKVEL